MKMKIAIQSMTLILIIRIKDMIERMAATLSKKK